MEKAAEQRIGVEDVNITMIEKAKCVKIVEEACRAKDENDIKKEMTERVEKKNAEGSRSGVREDQDHLGHCTG